MGFDASVISGVNKFIEQEFELSKIELGWAVSSLTLSATIAMLLSGPLSDRFGRRTILKYAAALYTISALASAFAPNFIFLVIARMLGGFGVGASLIIAPVFIAEISPAQIRGRMVSFNQLNIVLGISAAFFTNYLILQLGKSSADWTQSFMFDAHNWRYMLGVEAIPAILYFIGLYFVPRSPRWLIMKDELGEAHEVMHRSIGPEKTEEEISNIQNSLKEQEGKPKAKLGELFMPTMKLVMLIGIVIGVLQQITGINSVFFYAPMIFEQSGIGTDASFVQAIFVGIINLVFTVLAILLIDKLGRKPLLIFGVAGIALSMFVLSYSFGTATYSLSGEAIETLPADIDRQALSMMESQTYHSDIEYKSALRTALGAEATASSESVLISAGANINSLLVLICILVFVASFAFSLGPVMWVLFSELFPNRLRGLAISFVGLINSAISFIVQLVFPWELENLGSSTTFLIYGIFAVAGLVFVLTKLPETKGKTLEQLETELIR